MIAESDEIARLMPLLTIASLASMSDEQLARVLEYGARIAYEMTPEQDALLQAAYDCCNARRRYHACSVQMCCYTVARIGHGSVSCASCCDWHADPRR